MNWHREAEFKGLYVFLALLLICTDVSFAAGPAYSASLSADMSDCTRIEVLFESSAFEYLLDFGAGEPLIFSPKEKAYLKSIKKTVCIDRNAIVAFAYDLGDGRYTGPGRGRVKHRTRVVGYKDDKKILSFQIGDGAPVLSGGSLYTESGDSYTFPGGFPSFLSLVDKQLGPYLMRSHCALNLGNLGGRMFGLMRDAELPRPSEWCDVIARRMQRLGFLPTRSQRTQSQRSVFECPSARTCHFAMNAHCTARSPSGTVLLFESKPGWNQHGGPGLFSMDNHKPKGGLVILKDKGLTMKFIRSQEELKKLRWK